MSLNHREIDLVLSELDVVGSQIQRIAQPAYDTLVLSLYKPSAAVDLLICLAHGACRVHATTIPVIKSEKPLRFAELLRSRLRNGRIESIEQLGAERIVRAVVRVIEREEAEPAAPGERSYIRYRLYARLWSGAANLILTDESGRIVDALARRPQRGELAGGYYRPEDSDMASGLGNRVFEIRSIPGPGSFNSKIDALYAQAQGELSRDQLLDKARQWHTKRRSALEARQAELRRTESEFSGAERLRELGDILMGSVGAPRVEDAFLAAQDFYQGGEIHIQIDPHKSIVENAQAYYERYRKAKSGLQEVQSEIAEVQKRLSRLESEMEELEAQENPYVLRAFLSRHRSIAAKDARSYPGLTLEREGWRILVGRSAKENDELLRRHVRGNDLWVHARDWPGAYVFVKNRPGKTVPLEILLDAGTLALYYSRGRSSGQGDLYYTQVKYLRRAKDGPKGLVLPSREKNLHVQIEADRLRSLRSLIGQYS